MRVLSLSLAQYKESLLGAAAHGDLGNTDDPRRIIVTEFRVVFEDELTVCMYACM